MNRLNLLGIYTEISGGAYIIELKKIYLSIVKKMQDKSYLFKYLSLIYSPNEKNNSKTERYFINLVVTQHYVCT